MKAQAIIPAAGFGIRLQASVPKALVELDGKPLLIYTLEAFQRSSLIDSVVLVVVPEQLDDFKKTVKQQSLSKVARIVPGGQTRRESVCRGLKVIDDDTQIIAIHDGARPLISPETIDEAVRQCELHDAVVVGVPVKPTIKEVDQQNLLIEGTLKREKLWEAQTPQVFKKKILMEAHHHSKGNPSDDAVLIEQMGVKVKILKGDYKNLKITTQEDLVIAEAFLGLRHK